jgi:hypothetical protein
MWISSFVLEISDSTIASGAFVQLILFQFVSKNLKKSLLPSERNSRTAMRIETHPRIAPPDLLVTSSAIQTKKTQTPIKSNLVGGESLFGNAESINEEKNAGVQNSRPRVTRHPKQRKKWPHSDRKAIAEEELPTLMATLPWLAGVCCEGGAPTPRTWGCAWLI